MKKGSPQTTKEPFCRSGRIVFFEPQITIRSTDRLSDIRRTSDRQPLRTTGRGIPDRPNWRVFGFLGHSVQHRTTVSSPIRKLSLRMDGPETFRQQNVCGFEITDRLTTPRLPEWRRNRSRRIVNLPRRRHHRRNVSARSRSNRKAGSIVVTIQVPGFPDLTHWI